MTPNAEGAPYGAQQGECPTPEPMQTRSAASKPTDDVPPASNNEPEGQRQVALASAAAGFWFTPFSAWWATSQQNRYHRTQPKVPILSQPYCTQACLIGLAQGSPLDSKCPNVKDHGTKHLDLDTFRRRVTYQCAMDLDPYANCAPLRLDGSRGALFKLRLASHGYTFVAKGMEEEHEKVVQYESQVYKHLQPIQGRYIPVCLGRLDLALPWVHGGRDYGRLLLMSWGGNTLYDSARDLSKTTIKLEATHALMQIHQNGVLHRNVEIRHMLYNSQTETIMIVDFKRSKIPHLEALAYFSRRSSGNEPGGKRKCEELPREHAEAFIGEFVGAMRRLETEILDVCTFNFADFIRSFPTQK